MSHLRLLSILTVLACLILTGCPEKECAPGATQACLCGGGLEGAQICADDGMSWETCDCGVADDDDDDVVGDDDDVVGDDDDVVGDDDDVVGDDDDTVSDDDDVVGDDDDTVGDDDDSVGDDDDSEPCCSDCDYPAYVIDGLELTTFLESSTYNEFLNLLLVDALPPISDSVVILFDPDQDLVGVSSFNARFGIGEVTQDLYSFDGGATAVDWEYSQDGSRNFTTVASGLLLNLSFGVTVPVYEASVSGTFSASYDAVTTGAIRGAIMETDTENIETSFGNLHDLMDGRELDADTDGNGSMDGWTFVMEFTGVQFM